VPQGHGRTVTQLRRDDRRRNLLDKLSEGGISCAEQVDAETAKAAHDRVRGEVVARARRRLWGWLPAVRTRRKAIVHLVQ
jgi:hypothetical protein